MRAKPRHRSLSAGSLVLMSESRRPGRDDRGRAWTGSAKSRRGVIASANRSSAITGDFECVQVSVERIDTSERTPRGDPLARASWGPDSYEVTDESCK